MIRCWRCGIYLASLVLLVGCGRPYQAARPASVVLIVVDTLRPDFLGVYGSRSAVTPSIDGLAADGIVFENAVSPSPITAPSHATLFTSRHPSELGVVNNAVAKLPQEVPVMAEILAGAGLETAAVVAIAPLGRSWGFDRGFKTFEDRLRDTWILNADEVLSPTLDVLAHLDPPFFLWSHWADPHEPYNAHDTTERSAEVFLGGKRLGQVPTSTSAVERFEIELKRGDNELVILGDHPFRVRRLSLRRRGWIKPEIDPERPPAEHFTEYRATITNYRRRRVQLVVQLSDFIVEREEVVERYAREVAYVDRHVGRLIQQLKSRRLYHDSLILLTSDHGEGLGCHGYRGHVQTLYDCMVRVPLILKPPLASGVAGGQRRQDLVGLVDVLPTLLGLLGVEPRPAMRGRDLLSSVAETPSILLETHRPQAQNTIFGLRGERHSIFFDVTSGAWEFYDLEKDPPQFVDRFDPESPKVAEWMERLRRRLREETQPLPGIDVSRELDDETRTMLRSLGYL
ncbi:MAG: sulfatase [Acidobacteriota bacterium]